MERYVLQVITLASLILPLFLPRRAVAHLPPSGIRLVATSPNSITLTCNAPTFSLLRSAEGMHIESAWPLRELPGQPPFPYTAVLVALPPDGEIETFLETAPGQEVPLSLPLAVTTEDEEPAPKAGSSSFFLEETAVMRGVRLGRVVCAPFSVERKTLRIIPQATLVLRWSKAEPAPNLEGNPFFSITRAVINPEHLAIKTGQTQVANTRSSVQALMHILEAGVYRLTYAQLAPLGFGGSQWEDVHLWQGEAEIALDLEEDGDGEFDPGEAFYFYAEPRPSRWEQGDVLRLTLEERAPARMGVRDAFPTGGAGNIWVESTWEGNLDYAPDRLTPNLPFGRDGDRWFWFHLQRPSLGEESVVVPFRLTSVAVSVPASLTLWLLGQTSLAPNPDHRVAVRLNGVPLGEVTWDGRQAITATLGIPLGILQNGDNSLRLDVMDLPGVTMDALWLDAFTVRYAYQSTAVGRLLFEGEPTPRQYAITFESVQGVRVYDVTEPLAPKRLQGWQTVGNQIRLGDLPNQGGRHYWVGNASGFLSPVRLWAPRDVWAYEAGVPPEGAKFLIITHPDLAEAALALKARRTGQGVSTVVANVEGVYDGWGEGRTDPQAIVRFVRYAYETWQPQPQYLLLMGDGSYDPRRYRANSPITFIPPYLLDVPPRFLETAADNRYACVDGDDALPDLAVGRLPAQSAAEAAAYVAKLNAYETAFSEGAWRWRAMFVADDPDTGGDFTAFSEANAARFSVSWEVQRLHCLGVAPDVSDCTPAEVNALRQALGSYWRQGMGLVEYTGHSSWHQWAVERFLHIEEVPGLTANGRWPIVASWTCFTSAFHRPEWVLDERLVMDPQAGAIATWGPASLGTEPAHRTLADGFHEALLGGPVSTLGEAADAGKLALFIKGPEFDLLDTYTLLGDPSLRPAFFLPAGESRYFLPLIRKR